MAVEMMFRMLVALRIAMVMTVEVPEVFRRLSDFIIARVYFQVDFRSR